jgi:RNA polymerase sigma-70 factor (sigma-E family)
MRVTARGGVGRAPADPEPFDDFFRVTYVGSVRLAHLLTGDRWAAEDLAQEAYTRLHPRYARLDNPGAYLRVSLVNAAQSYHRRRGREQTRMQRLAPPPGTADAVDAADAASAVAQEVLAAIDGLPYRQKAVVVLRYYEDMSEADIATVLGCRPGTVKSLASRALARLEKEISR